MALPSLTLKSWRRARWFVPQRLSLPPPAMSRVVRRWLPEQTSDQAMKLQILHANPSDIRQIYALNRIL